MKKVLLLLALLFVPIVFAQMDVSVVKGEMSVSNIKHDFTKASMTVSPENAVSSDHNFEQTIHVYNNHTKPLYYFVDVYYGDAITKISLGSNVLQPSIAGNDSKLASMAGVVKLANDVAYTNWGDVHHYFTLNGTVVNSKQNFTLPIKYTTLKDKGKFNVSIWASETPDFSCVLDANKTCLLHYTIDPQYTISQTTGGTANSQGIRNGINQSAGSGTDQWYGQTFLINGSLAENVTITNITLELASVAGAGNCAVNVRTINSNTSNITQVDIGNNVTIVSADFGLAKNYTFNFTTNPPSILANESHAFIFSCTSTNVATIYGTGTAGLYPQGTCIFKDDSGVQRSNCLGIAGIDEDLYFIIYYNTTTSVGAANYTVTIVNQTWVTPVYEATLNNFTINISWGANVTNVSSANLTYNNTVYVASNLTNGSLGVNNTWRVFNVTIPAAIITGANVNQTNITFNWSFYVQNDNGTSTINTTANNGQVVNKFMNISVVYSGNVSNGTFNFARNLTINVSYFCASNATVTINRNINNTVQTTQNIACTNTTQLINTSYVHSVEGNFTINYSINISPYGNVSTGQQNFVSDLNSPIISNLTFLGRAEYFNIAPQFNATMTCYDNFYSPLNYTLIVNSNVLFNSTRSNNTMQINLTTVSTGINNLTGICADAFGNVTNTTNRSITFRILALIDEVDNTAFDVTNVSSARVYLDDNSTFFDFKTNNTNTTNFTTVDNTRLRFEIKPDNLTGTTITRYIDTNLTGAGTLRVCANKQGVTHFEQIITSAIERPVTMLSIFSTCYVAADYTRFAFQDRKALKVFTIQVPYYLSAIVNDEEVLIASLDGSIQTEINLDVLELIATPYDFSIISSALSVQHNANSTVTIFYENIAGDNTAGNITIRNLNDGSLAFTTTTFANPNDWTLVFDYSTLNVSNNTMFQVVYIATNPNGQKTSKIYFNGRGADGILMNELAAMLAVMFLLFGITLTSARITFAWFGLFICIGAFLILTLAAGGVWYITFLQAITAIVFVFIVINLVKQGGETIT